MLLLMNTASSKITAVFRNGSDFPLYCINLHVSISLHIFTRYVKLITSYLFVNQRTIQNFFFYLFYLFAMLVNIFDRNIINVYIFLFDEAILQIHIESLYIAYRYYNLKNAYFINDLTLCLLYTSLVSLI